MKCLISIPLQARYHYYPFLQTEVLRGCLLTHPSSHSQGALAFSENPKFCGLSEAASKQAPPADVTKPLCQTTQDGPRVCLASSLWLHPSEEVVLAPPSRHRPARAH